jgi:hypothetical protein
VATVVALAVVFTAIGTLFAGTMASAAPGDSVYSVSFNATTLASDFGIQGAADSIVTSATDSTMPAGMTSALLITSGGGWPTMDMQSKAPDSTMCAFQPNTWYQVTVWVKGDLFKFLMTVPDTATADNVVGLEEDAQRDAYPSWTQESFTFQTGTATTLGAGSEVGGGYSLGKAFDLFIQAGSDDFYVGDMAITETTAPTPTPEPTPTVEAAATPTEVSSDVTEAPVTSGSDVTEAPVTSGSVVTEAPNTGATAETTGSAAVSATTPAAVSATTPAAVTPTPVTTPTTTPVKVAPKKIKTLKVTSPKKVTSKTKTIKGKTEKKAKVTLLNGKKKVKAATANAKGKFTLKKVNLKKLKGKKLTLKATKSGFTAKSIKVKVK